MVDVINLQYPAEIVQYYSPNYVRRPQNGDRSSRLKL